MAMDIEQVKRIIRDGVQQGYSLDQLANALISSGASQDMTTQAIAEAGREAGRPTDPKYRRGDTVNVRDNTSEWTVQETQRERNPDGSVRTRYLIKHSTGGNSRIEEESQLRPTGETRNRLERQATPPPFPGEPAKPKKAEVTFDSVIIEDEKRNQIIQALGQLKYADLIFEKWGFGETIEKGKGVGFLFYGPPGTGKTLMAQAIANKLEKKLVVISTADIESSVPGEAERNIKKAFESAAKENQVLLFDECDSLIFSRESAGPILGAQVNQLLSSLEKFDGVTVFTTNRLGQLDEAVNRRLALKLEFALPTEDERAKIWRRMIPEAAPLHEDVDFDRLAFIPVTGGYIKNAVLRAARMAAVEDMEDNDKKITMDHLIAAIEQEVTSMEEFEDARKAVNGKYVEAYPGSTDMGKSSSMNTISKIGAGK